MGIWQVMMIVLLSLELYKNYAHDGELKEESYYNFKLTLIALSILMFILTAGGFFG
jgi:hypothetical protein